MNCAKAIDLDVLSVQVALLPSTVRCTFEIARVKNRVR